MIVAQVRDHPLPHRPSITSPPSSTSDRPLAAGVLVLDRPRRQLDLRIATSVFEKF